MDAARCIRDAYGYMQTPELDALEEVIDTLVYPSVAVNIGAGFGTSGLAFIQSPKVSRLYTVELYAKMADNGLGSLEFERGSFERFGYDKDPRYMQINMDSAQAGKAWPFGLVDMIFLDGDHSYEQVKKDILAWLPNLKENGIFSFHDYGPEDGLAGVSTAVDELIVPHFVKISHAKAFAAFRRINASQT